jgi:hypothetical protein
MFGQLANYRVVPELWTRPVDGWECSEGVAEAGAEPVKVPKLLKTYLAIGARVASEPAWDREFGTIDFLTLMDLRTISSAARNRFLAPL